jgi:hypothetical protein
MTITEQVNLLGTHCLYPGHVCTTSEPCTNCNTMNIPSRHFTVDYLKVGDRIHTRTGYEPITSVVHYAGLVELTAGDRFTFDAGESWPVAYDDVLLFSARDTAVVRQLAESDCASDYERVRLW